MEEAATIDRNDPAYALEDISDLRCYANRLADVLGKFEHQGSTKGYVTYGEYDYNLDYCRHWAFKQIHELHAEFSYLANEPRDGMPEIQIAERISD